MNEISIRNCPGHSLARNSSILHRLSVVACPMFLFAALPPAASDTTPPTAVQTGQARRVIAADDSKKTLASVGRDGRVEWRLPIRAIHDLHLLPDGHIL